MKFYEGLFLMDNTAAPDWKSMEAEVRRLMDRAGAAVHVCVKFDERKLAYEIEGRKRGTYILAYFDAPQEKMSALERDVQLSESILRAMFLRCAPLSEARMAELRAHPVDQPLKPMGSGDRDRGDRHDRGDRYDRGDRGDRFDRGDRGDRGDRASRESDEPAEIGAE